jgi:hypothetical protein
MLTAANVHDSTVFEELVDSVPPAKGKRGRPHKRDPTSCTPTKATTTPAAAGSWASGTLR